MYGAAVDPTGKPLSPPDSRLVAAVQRWEERSYYAEYGEFVVPHQWGNTDTVATLHRRGSWTTVLAQVVCVATPPVGWVIGGV